MKIGLIDTVFINVNKLLFNKFKSLINEVYKIKNKSKFFKLFFSINLNYYNNY